MRMKPSTGPGYEVPEKYWPEVHESEEWGVVEIYYMSPRENKSKESLVQLVVLDAGGRRLDGYYDSEGEPHGRFAYVRWGLPIPVGNAAERPLRCCCTSRGCAEWDYRRFGSAWMSLAVGLAEDGLPSFLTLVSRIRSDWTAEQAVETPLPWRKIQLNRSGEHWWIITIKEKPALNFQLLDREGAN